MSQRTRPKRRWEKMRTLETRRVERVLRKEFHQTDAYRYNSASIRVRVVDPRFEGKSDEDREAMLAPLLSQLPKRTQDDIFNLLMISPDELEEFDRRTLLNEEFEDPSPSKL